MAGLSVDIRALGLAAPEIQTREPFQPGSRMARCANWCQIRHHQNICAWMHRAQHSGFAACASCRCAAPALRAACAAGLLSSMWHDDHINGVFLYTSYTRTGKQAENTGWMTWSRLTWLLRCAF